MRTLLHAVCAQASLITNSVGQLHPTRGRMLAGADGQAVLLAAASSSLQEGVLLAAASPSFNEGASCRVASSRRLAAASPLSTASR